MSVSFRWLTLTTISYNTIQGRCDIANNVIIGKFSTLKKVKSWLCQLTLWFLATIYWIFLGHNFKKHILEKSISGCLFALSILSSVLDFPLSAYVFWLFLSAPVSKFPFSLVLSHYSAQCVIITWTKLSSQFTTNPFHCQSICLYLLFGIPSPSSFYLMHYLHSWLLKVKTILQKAMPANEEFFLWLQKTGEKLSLFININFWSTKYLKGITNSSFLVIYLLLFGYSFSYLLQGLHLFTGSM